VYCQIYPSCLRANRKSLTRPASAVPRMVLIVLSITQRQYATGCIRVWTRLNRNYRLGRPAQKRNRAEPTSTQPTGQPDSEEQTTLEFEDDVSHDVGDFLLSQQGTDTDAIFDSKPTRSEMIEASFSPFNLLPALLARDKQFASAIGSQPLVGGSVIEMIDETTMALLDQQ